MTGRPTGGARGPAGAPGAVGATTARPLPPEAWLTALAGLPGVGPVRLLALHRADGPEGAWKRVLAGAVLEVAELDGRLGPDPAGLVGRWARQARAVDVAAQWEAQQQAGIAAVALGSPGYPARLAEGPEPPAVLFWRGALAALHGPSVAVVGTRGCTRAGYDIAVELGRGLAEAGVAVISGLALGIDGAAHRGALDAAARPMPAVAPPIGVVANGLDVAYPKRHARLQGEVERRGVLLSEAPLGVAPEPWRFPARNRIIAGLADAVVVVESRATGGSMHTADEALDRGTPVMAVPGSVRSPASAGTNHLLSAGASIARDVDDVLAAIGLAGRRGGSTSARSWPPGMLPHADGPAAGAPALGPDARCVLDAVAWEAVTFEQLVARVGGDMAAVAGVVAELERHGLLVRNGGWLERAVLRHG